MPHGSIAPAESDLEECRQLTAEHERWLAETFPGWGSRQVKSLTQQKASRRLSALLWESDDRLSRGLALVSPAQNEAGIHGLWLRPWSLRSLGDMLSGVEHEIPGPVQTVTDVLPEPDPEEQSRWFRARGFWHRQKVLMRLTSPTSAETGHAPREIRPLRRADLEQVVGLYVRAHTSRPGEFWTWGPPDNWAEAQRDVMDHVDAEGHWTSDFLPDASFVWESHGRVLGAVLVDADRRGCSYVSDLLVEPEFHRQGIGRSLMERSIQEIQHAGPQLVELAAIRFGAPYRLYRRLGFEEVPPPQGRLDGQWVRGKVPEAVSREAG